ncbi:hypothetical protein C0Q70_21620 [Pomacea canaliculata]|uniref:Methionine--tRNA ligase, mitochondrial n=2 Tax=Pomacea canaliculata TaxID=400727 RepID=A0A2T7ND21_POMCA|nr:hypothetical protein C0Q70_21620 [Pomacea canaliculata]
MQRPRMFWKRQKLRNSYCCLLKRTATTGVESLRDDGVPYLITTPIFYVNAAPHIGHLYTVMLADAACRWQRLKGQQVLFSVGTDEHGLKIQQAAESHNTSPQLYCDRVSAMFKDLFEKGNITYNEFIRTTENRHFEAVQTFWEILQNRGYIYKGQYEGWYSISDEAFLTDEEVQDTTSHDGKVQKVAVSSGQPVTWMKEENYIFRLSAFNQQLTSWLDAKVIQPAQFEPLVRSWVENLPDLSVSRQRQRLSWGIPVPGDSSQTIYVWLDALINYLTVAGYPSKFQHAYWPPACQVIGKDILRFHAVYWPAFLFAAGLSPPSKILCHSHWLVDGHKMSKSRGNVVDPMDRLERYTADGLRYFLLKEGAYTSDGNYSDARVVERINSDLVNSIGNLLNRVTAPSVNKQQYFPALDDITDLSKFLSQEDVEKYHSLAELADQISLLYDDYAFSRALDKLLTHIYWANGLVQAHAPWVLAKSSDAESQRHLKTILHVAMETLRICGILLQPVIPVLSDRMLTRLGVSQTDRGIADCKQNSLPILLGSQVLLLNRISASK